MRWIYVVLSLLVGTCGVINIPGGTTQIVSTLRDNQIIKYLLYTCCLLNHDKTTPIYTDIVQSSGFNAKFTFPPCFRSTRPQERNS